MTLAAERTEEVRDASYYDAHYREETPKQYQHYIMYPVWQQAAAFLATLTNPDILELGCGTGGLAHVLKDAGVTQYRGLDFSEEAVTRARQRVDADFVVSDLTNLAWAGWPYDAVVAIEVLEHLADDLAVVRAIRPGTHVVFSVPNLNCAGHVRWFGSPRQVADHYRGLITLQKTEIFLAGTAKWFVCHGTRDR